MHDLKKQFKQYEDLHLWKDEHIEEEVGKEAKLQQINAKIKEHAKDVDPEGNILNLGKTNATDTFKARNKKSPLD